MVSESAAEGACSESGVERATDMPTSLHINSGLIYGSTGEAWAGCDRSKAGRMDCGLRSRELIRVPFAEHLCLSFFAGQVTSVVLAKTLTLFLLSGASWEK